jgi:hypothetical protein
MTFKPSLLKTRKDLIKALEDKGLPASIPRLNYFEEIKIIKFPKYGLKRGMNGFDRLYTEKEIENAVVSVKEYVDNKKQFGNMSNERSERVRKLIKKK